MDDKLQKERHFPMFSFFSGGIKNMVEKALFKMIGVEVNAKIGYNDDKKKAAAKKKK